METAITSLNNLIRDYIIKLSCMQILRYANQFFFAPRAIPFKSMGGKSTNQVGVWKIPQKGWGFEKSPKRVGMGVKH